MIRRLLILVLLVSPAVAQTLAKTPPLWCQTGTTAITQALASTSTVEVGASGSNCSIQVNVHGGGAATIYSDSAFTPLSNPFNANSDTTYGFYASTSSHYDIITSLTVPCIPLVGGCSAGGTVTIVTTLTDVVVGATGGGGGGPVLQVNGTDTSNQGLANFVAGTNVTITNPSGGIIQITASGGGGGGTPGGTNTEDQYNASGSFAGAFNSTYTSSTGEHDVANLAHRRFVTGFYQFSFTDSGGSIGNLTSAGTGITLTLPCTAAAPCAGFDTSNNTNSQYGVYISGTGTAEFSYVTGGTCTKNLNTASCTLVVNTLNNHPNGYTVSSGSGGMREAMNEAGTPGADLWLMPSTTYHIYDPVYLNGNKVGLHCNGAVIENDSRLPAVISGDRTGGLGNQNSLYDCEFTVNTNVDGSLVASIVEASGSPFSIYTVTTTAAHNFVNNIPAALGTWCPNFFSTQFTVCPGLDWATVFVSTPAFTGEIHTQVLTGNNCTPSACSSTQFQFTLWDSNTFSSSSGYGWAAVHVAAFEDYGTDNNLYGPKIKTGAGGRFNFGFMNSDDQAENIYGATNEGSGGEFQCTANFCAPFIWMRGDQGVAPILRLYGANISLGCHGNGIRSVANNTMEVYNSIVEGYNQYGIFYGSTGSGFQPWSAGHVYEEGSTQCYNLSYPTGFIASQAGFITSGNMTFVGTEPSSGLIPTFPNGSGVVNVVAPSTINLVSGTSFQSDMVGGEIIINGTQLTVATYVSSSQITVTQTLGSVSGVNEIWFLPTSAGTFLNYYAVPKIGTQYGTMNLMGHAVSDGTGTINIYWPQILLKSVGSGVTWDILQTSGATAVPPYLGAANSITTGISGSCSSAGICTYADTQPSTLTPYTITPTQVGMAFEFWPAGFAISNSAILYADQCGQLGAFATTTYFPQVYAKHYVTAGQADNYNPYFCVAEGGDAHGAQVGAIVKPAALAGGPTAGLKGTFSPFLNFKSLQTTDFLTLLDSHPFKTMATGGYMPAWDTADCAFGTDPASAGAALTSGSTYWRCPQIDMYVGGITPTSTATNWNVRLNSAGFQTSPTTTSILYGPAIALNTVTGFSPFSYSGSQVSDTFSASCSGSNLGSNWTVTDGTFGCGSGSATVASLGVDTFGLAAYTGASFNSDGNQRAQATLSVAGGNHVGVCVRMSSSASTAYCWFGGSSGLDLWKIIAGTPTNLFTCGGGCATGLGDTLTLEVYGTTLIALKDGIIQCSSPPCTSTATDSAITSGSPGVGGGRSGSGTGVSNFSGGDADYTTNAKVAITNIAAGAPIAGGGTSPIGPVSATFYVQNVCSGASCNSGVGDVCDKITTALLKCPANSASLSPNVCKLIVTPTTPGSVDVCSSTTSDFWAGVKPLNVDMDLTDQIQLSATLNWPIGAHYIHSSGSTQNIPGGGFIMASSGFTSTTKFANNSSSFLANEGPSAFTGVTPNVLISDGSRSSASAINQWQNNAFNAQWVGISFDCNFTANCFPYYTANLQEGSKLEEVRVWHTVPNSGTSVSACYFFDHYASITGNSGPSHFQVINSYCDPYAGSSGTTTNNTVYGFVYNANNCSTSVCTASTCVNGSTACGNNTASGGNIRYSGGTIRAAGASQLMQDAIWINAAQNNVIENIHCEWQNSECVYLGAGGTATTQSIATAISDVNNAVPAVHFGSTSTGNVAMQSDNGITDDNNSCDPVVNVSFYTQQGGGQGWWNGGFHVCGSGNTDASGNIALSGVTTGSYNFTGTYSVAPQCTITPTSNMSTTLWWVTSTTSAVTVTTSANFTGNFNYHCTGRGI